MTRVRDIRLKQQDGIENTKYYLKFYICCIDQIYCLLFFAQQTVHVSTSCDQSEL